MAERISEREAEVLSALGSRLTNAQIANRLHVSVRTVESHVSSLLRKYGVADRWALAELARSEAPEPGRVVGRPASGTTFVGRDAERAGVLAALEEARLVTLLGPGGVGKTRLATVVAAEAGGLFPSGGAFVDLVPVRDGFVARAAATALGVTEGSHQPLADAVAARLGTGRSLLVLDNCEHVIDEAAAFAERILAACPGTRVLVTSRERLGLQGERSVPVTPLPGSDAEALFHDRALAADPGFVAAPAVIADLCARLDGMPLAIELAAARGASLGATGLLAALEDALRLLSGGRGGDERHRSLRAVLSWSHDLLDEEEKALFRRLGVFAGAFDMDAAAAVGGDALAGGCGGPPPTRNQAGVADLLGRLVDKSLVVHQRGRVSRWRLLETVRAFARAQLSAAGEVDEIGERHLRWAADAASALEGRIGDPVWREDFDAMAADLRSALAASGGPGEVTHRLASALAHLTFARRHLLESFAHYRTAAAVAPDAATAAADLRAGAGCAHVSTTSNQHVFELLLEAAEQARRAGDRRGRAVDLARAVETACRFPEAFESGVSRERLHGLFAEAAGQGAGQDDPEAAACVAVARAWLDGLPSGARPLTGGGRGLEDGLPSGARPLTGGGRGLEDGWGAPDAETAPSALAAARATGDPVLISSGLCAAATAALRAGRLREANRITRERLDLLPSMDRDDPYCAPEICNTYGRACIYAIMAGDLRGGMAAARAGMDDDLLRDTHITASRLVQPLALTGRFRDAIGHAGRMWDQWERAGRPAPRWMLPAVCTTVLACGILRDAESVALWRSRAAEVAGGALDTEAVAVFVDARLAVHDGRFEEAGSLVRRAFAVDAPLDPYLAYARAAGVELAVAAGLPDAAELLASAAPLAEENGWAAACLARARWRLHGDPDELTRALEAWERLDAQAERDCTRALQAQPG